MRTKLDISVLNTGLSVWFTLYNVLVSGCRLPDHKSYLSKSVMLEWKDCRLLRLFCGHIPCKLIGQTFKDLSSTLDK